MNAIQIPPTGQSLYDPNFFGQGVLTDQFLPALQHELCENLEPILRRDGDPSYFRVVEPRSTPRQAEKQLQAIDPLFPGLRQCIGIILNSFQYPAANMIEVGLLGYGGEDALEPHIDRRKEVVALFNIMGAASYVTYERGIFDKTNLKTGFDDPRLRVSDSMLLAPGALLVTNGDCEPEEREPHSAISHSDPRFVLAVRRVVNHELLIPGTQEFSTALSSGIQVSHSAVS